MNNNNKNYVRKEKSQVKSGSKTLANCVGVRCDVDARMTCSKPYTSSSVVPDQYCQWTVLNTVNSSIKDCLE